MEDCSLYLKIESHLLNDAMPSQYLQSISQTEAFQKYPFDIISCMQETNQSPKHHPEGSVWKHTLLVVDEAAKRKHKSTDPRAFMWAALLHDIGKPPTTKVRRGKITSYDHDKVGARLSEKFLKEMHEKSSFITHVCNLVRYHMQILYVTKGLPFAEIENMKSCLDLDEIALLCFCDRLGRGGVNQREEEENVEKFLRICRKDGTKHGAK